MSISFEENRLMTTNVYGNENDPTTEKLQAAGWQLYNVNTGTLQSTWGESDFTTEANGFGAALYVKRDSLGKVTDAVIAYRGTELSSDLHDLGADIDIALATPIATNPQFADAENFYKTVVNTVLPGLGVDPTQINLSFTGHSLGGGLAQYMGAITGLETETFNAVGVKDIVSPLISNLDSRPLNINNYIVNEDFVSASYDQVGQNHYATIEATSTIGIDHTLNEHMIPILASAIAPGHVSSISEGEFTGTAPDADSTGFYNLRAFLLDNILTGNSGNNTLDGETGNYRDQYHRCG